jgi:hypothetical protein
MREGRKVSKRFDGRMSGRRMKGRTHVFNQLNGVLVNRQVNDRSVTTDVEDRVKVRSGEGGKLDGVLYEFLSGLVLEELGAEIIAFECFDRGLVER